LRPVARAKLLVETTGPWIAHGALPQERCGRHGDKSSTSIGRAYPLRFLDLRHTRLRSSDRRDGGNGNRCELTDSALTPSQSFAHRFLQLIAGSLGLLDLPFMSASKRFKLKLRSGLDIASRACAGLPDLTSHIRPTSTKVCQALRGDLKAPAPV
jgi:hypothetical protein